MKKLNRFSFGATSSITTSLSIIVGLDATAHPKLTIISALAVLAVADNISDSLGIHMYREAENAHQTTWYTFTNFFTRLVLTGIFAAIVLFLPDHLMVPFTIALGMTVLSVLSYGIAVDQKINPPKEILKHLFIAVIAMTASHFVGESIRLHIN